MGIDDALFDAKAAIEDYLTWKKYDEQLEADIRWLMERMQEMQRFLESPPGHEQPNPEFRKRFGEKPLGS